MKKLLILLFIFGHLFAKSNLFFKEKYIDPVHETLIHLRTDKIQIHHAETASILQDAYQPDDKQMFASMEAMEIPVNNDVFKTYFHFPPKHQGLTSTCWAHTGISFIESETERNFSKNIKLSVMFIVYYDFLEKSLFYVKTRGSGGFRRGSQIVGVFNIAEKYGLIPELVYDGPSNKKGYDLGPLQDELEAYLDFIKENNFWDEQASMMAVKGILDKHLGAIPESFMYQGKQFNCKSFYDTIIQFNPNNYTSLQSTLRFPFGKKAEFPFPDHWWHGKDFLNIPLDNFYNSIVNTIKAGITVPIGGDTSEPGYNRYTGIAFIPSAVISQENQN